MVKGKRAVALACIAALSLTGLAGCVPNNAKHGSQGLAAGSAAGDGSVPIEGSAPVEAPTEAPVEPVQQHDFECDWFYVDVPDTWVNSQSGEANTWFVEGPTDNGDGTVSYRFQATGPNVGADGNKKAGTVIVGGQWSERYTVNVGTAPDGSGVYLFEVGAGLFATDGYFEGSTFVTFANGVTAPDAATITLKTADSVNSGESASNNAAGSTTGDEAAFVAAARAALHVPDDPSITYAIEEPVLWEADGRYITDITFYQNGQAVAFAYCFDDGTLARNIYMYTAP